jgi:hypothetical protein
MAAIDPVDESIRSVALPFAAKPKNLNGELVGDVGFDPFKFSDKGDLAKFRVAELKHGRVCMLACLGILVQEVFRWNDAFPSKNFLEAVKTAPALGLLQVGASARQCDAIMAIECICLHHHTLGIRPTVTGSTQRCLCE